VRPRGEPDHRCKKLKYGASISINGDGPPVTPYRERVWASFWVSFLFGLAVGVVAVIGLIQHYLDVSIGSRPAPTAFLFALDLFLVLIYLNFAKMDLYIDEDGVEVRYGIVRKRIPLHEIESSLPTKTPFTVYGGIGIRFGADGSLAFTTSFGNAVKVLRKRGMPLVFSTNKPHEVSKLINSLVGETV